MQRIEEYIMTSEFEKEYLPIWCEDCDLQGYIFIDDLESSYFVTCNTCGWETSYVCCPKCQMGGEFVRNVSKRPVSWTCPSCKMKYTISSTMYENPIRLYVEKDLPTEIRRRIVSTSSSGELSSPVQKLYAHLFLIVTMAVLIIPWWLIYKLVNYLLASMMPIGMVLFFVTSLAWLFIWRHFLIVATPRINKWRLKMITK